jgi:ABC-type sugar transport system permease subunit
MLVALSIVNSAPKEIYEAGRVHGASAWQLFTRVSLPTILNSPVMQFVLILRFIDAMNSMGPYDWSIWEGYPTQIGTPVDTLSLFMYKLLFVPNLGFPINDASAIAVAMLALTLASVAGMTRLLGRIGRS